MILAEQKFMHHALHLPAHYVATDPDDMLAVQEWHMANEGLDTESVCP